MLYFTVICIALQCSGYCSVLKSQSKASETYYTDNIRGKIIVTGLSKSEDDEFLLSLLNGQVSCYSYKGIKKLLFYPYAAYWERDGTNMEHTYTCNR